jgi:hypothetical protein
LLTRKQRRLKKLECGKGDEAFKGSRKKLAPAEKKFVIMDFDGSYFGDCGSSISQEQLAGWLEKQEPTAEITIIKYLTEVLCVD